MIQYVRKNPIAKKVRSKQFDFKIKFCKWKGKNIGHFLHIGKTGGTAIKSAFGNQKLIEAPNYLFIMENHPVRLQDIPNNHQVFFIVRDPISKFISGFYSRYREGLPRIYNPWKEGEKEAFQKFPKPNYLAEALSSNEYGERMAAEKAMKSIGHVNNSFWDWFLNESYLKQRFQDILYVLTQENLDEDFKNFKQHFKVSKSELNQDPVKMHKNPEHFDKCLSNKAIQNLKEWYCEDYRFLEILKEYGLIKKDY